MIDRKYSNSYISYKDHTLFERCRVGLTGNTSNNFFKNTGEKVWFHWITSGLAICNSFWLLLIPWTKNFTTRSILLSIDSIQSNDCDSSWVIVWTKGMNSWKQLTRIGKRSFSFFVITESPTKESKDIKGLESPHVICYSRERSIKLQDNTIIQH